MKNTLCLVSLLFTLTAIAEPTRTVDWYRQHPIERAALLKECRNNPGELGDTPNCTNAEKADMLEAAAVGRFRRKPMTYEEIQQGFEELRRRGAQ